MTKDQAYKIIRMKYGIYNGDYMIEGLCDRIHPLLDADWDVYWNKINNEQVTFISTPLRYLEDKHILASLTRMMILHDFIEDTYK
jgi:hypothetical protein